MANNPVNIIGFETGDLSERAGGSGAASSVQSSIKYSGNYALRINPGSGTNSSSRFTTFTVAGQPVNINFTSVLYSSFYFYYATKPASTSEPMASILDGSSTLRLEIRLDASGRLSVYDSTATFITTGTTVLNPATWYRIDVLANAGTSAAYEVKINGVIEMSGTINLGAGSNFVTQLGKQPNRNNEAVDYYYDNVWLDTSDYAPENYAIGIMKPVSDAINDWTNGSAPSDYSTIDEVPISTADYIAPPGATGPMSATFGMQSFASAGIPSNASIHVVKSFTYGADISAVTNTYNNGILSGATSSVTNNNNFGSTALEASKLFTTDPNTSSAWTKSGLEAAKLQVIENTTGVTSMRVYAAFFMVAYTTPGASRRIFHIT